MQSAHIAWLAGLLEGEGCFHAASNGGPAVRLCMTDRDVVERARALLGVRGVVSVRPGTERTKAAYTISLTGSRAAGWMMTLYSLLGSRRRGRINSLLSAWKSLPGANRQKVACKRGHPLTGTNLKVVKLRDGRASRVCRECARLRQRAIPPEVRRARQQAAVMKNVAGRRASYRAYRSRQRANAKAARATGYLWGTA